MSNRDDLRTRLEAMLRSAPITQASREKGVNYAVALDLLRQLAESEAKVQTLCGSLSIRADELDENWKFIENLKSERDAALAQVAVLREALEELIEVADLRGDSDLPHPADDPKLWTARMIDAWDSGREALSDTSVTAHQFVQRIEREALEKAVDRVDMYVNQLHPPMGRAAAPLRAAILGEKENN